HPLILHKDAQIHYSKPNQFLCRNPRFMIFESTNKMNLPIKMAQFVGDETTIRNPNKQRTKLIQINKAASYKVKRKNKKKKPFACSKRWSWSHVFTVNCYSILPKIESCLSPNIGA
ncbi:hypothetical protein PanWU01x14_242590, partial [Parasponia andersonii]